MSNQITHRALNLRQTKTGTDSVGKTQSFKLSQKEKVKTYFSLTYNLHIVFVQLQMLNRDHNEWQQLWAC